MYDYLMNVKHLCDTIKVSTMTICESRKSRVLYRTTIKGVLEGKWGSRMKGIEGSRYL